MFGGSGIFQYINQFYLCITVSLKRGITLQPVISHEDQPFEVGYIHFCFWRVTADISALELPHSSES